MKFDTMINLALAAIVFKLVYDANNRIESIGNSVSGFIGDVAAGIDITEDTNYIYRNIGGDDWTVGTAIYDRFN